MTYWHKVQMSCRQTQPVVLRRGVRFRQGSLFLHQASGRVLICTRSLWNRNRGLCCHISCWHLPFTAVSFVFGQFGESLTNTNLTSRAFAITWTWRHFTNADGWHEWNDSRSAMQYLVFQQGRAGHLYQGGIWISRGGTNHVVCVCCVCARSVIACSCWRSLKGNRFMCVVLSVSLSLSKSITFSKEGRGWKVGGTVTRLLFATRLITKWICWMQNKHIFLRSNLPILRKRRVWRLR